MNKSEFINSLPELEDYTSINEYIQSLVPSNEGTLDFEGEQINYEEVNLEDFYNE